MSDPGYALVTGASQGIGEAIALELAGRGFGVLLTARSGPALNAVRDRCAALNNGRAQALAVDLFVSDGPQRIVEFVRGTGHPLTCLVNNAGHAHWGMFTDTPLEEHQRSIRLNMSVPVELTHTLLPDLLRAPRAWILNTSSMTAYHALASMALYASSKAFLLRWSRSLRLELRNTGVSVTALCPGSVTTGFTEHAGMQAMDDLARKFGMPPAPVAKKAVDAMLRGKAEVVPGWLNRLTRSAQRIMPMSVTERTASGIYLKRLAHRRRGG